MPYIKQERRNELLFDNSNHQALTSGELNFLITDVIRRYLINHGCSYQTINDIVGALEGAKLEFYRRVVAHYETSKIEINGDVY